MADDVWLVVGLGNPGPSYARTRHNIGHLVADELAARTGGKWKQHKQVKAEVIETRISGLRTVLAKPRSYMNESGGPVAGLCGFYKFGGGDNGHNGLKSLRKSLGTGEYYRVRFGVGRPPGRQAPADFVLNEFSSTERKDLPFAADRTADAVESLLTDGLEATQGKYNS